MIKFMSMSTRGPAIGTGVGIDALLVLMSSSSGVSKTIFEPMADANGAFIFHQG
jgi:lysyl-tRNA synthetase class II